MPWNPPQDLEQLLLIAREQGTEIFHRRRRRERAEIAEAYSAQGLTGGAVAGAQHRATVDAFREYATFLVDQYARVVIEGLGGITPEIGAWLTEKMRGEAERLASGVAQEDDALAERLQQEVITGWRALRLKIGPAEIRYAEQLRQSARRGALAPIRRDVFVSYASEDADDIARPIAERLKALGYDVWFAEFELTIGDSLLQQIDAGIVASRFGVVILSPHFFAKRWPQLELDGLAAREMIEGRKVLLPVWHNINAEGVARNAPSLARKLASNSARGLDAVVADIVRAMGAPNSVRATAEAHALKADDVKLRRRWEEVEYGGVIWGRRPTDPDTVLGPYCPTHSVPLVSCDTQATPEEQSLISVARPLCCPDEAAERFDLGAEAPQPLAAIRQQVRASLG